MTRFIFLFAFLFAGQVSSQSLPLIETDVRVRVVNNDLIYVVVQLNNNSGRTITELEGFLTEINPSSNIVSEREIVHLHVYESPLRGGDTVVRGFTYSFDKAKDLRYRYHISHIKFRNDPRIFTYNPCAGLIRIK